MNQHEKRELLDELTFLMSFGFTTPDDTDEQKAFITAVHNRVFEIQKELLEAGMTTPLSIPDGLR